MNCAVFTLEQGFKSFFKKLLRKTNKLGRREYDRLIPRKKNRIFKKKKKELVVDNFPH